MNSSVMQRASEAGITEQWKQGMQRILFIGDIHSDFESLEILSRFMLNRVPGISRIIQVGDFGFWPQQQSWLWYPQSTLPVPVYFIDGNHEDHPSLQAGSDRHPHRVNEKYDATYIPRGYCEDGIAFCGGATSHDRPYRTEGLDWFHEENISDAEIQHAIENTRGRQVRIMVAHETVREAFRLIKRPQWVFADQNRERLEELFHATSPEIYIHGHYHFHMEYEYQGCRFICLQNPDHFRHEIIQAGEMHSDEGYTTRVEDAFMHVAQRCCAVASVDEGIVEFR